MKIKATVFSSDHLLLLVCLFLFFVIFVIDASIPLGIAGGVPYILVVLISLWSPRKKMPVYMAATGSLLTIIGFFISPVGGELWQVIANRFLAIFAIWTATILSVQRKRLYEEKERAIEEIKILSGLLPICASCKNIKDDQGHWKQMESYIRDHSEAEFTHGICPDCAKKLYPDIDLYANKE